MKYTTFVCLSIALLTSINIIGTENTIEKTKKAEYIRSHDNTLKVCLTCGKERCSCNEKNNHSNEHTHQENTIEVRCEQCGKLIKNTLSKEQEDKKKCDNCPEGDPIEETTQLVLQAAPQVLNSFIKIVQDPQNKENIAQSITNIVSNIVAIATSAFKGKEREILEKELKNRLKKIVTIQVLKMRKNL